MSNCRVLLDRFHAARNADGPKERMKRSSLVFTLRRPCV
jgi:hypothetical protein